MKINSIIKKTASAALLLIAAASFSFAAYGSGNHNFIRPQRGIHHRFISCPLMTVEYSYMDVEYTYDGVFITMSAVYLNSINKLHEEAEEHLGFLSDNPDSEEFRHSNCPCSVPGADLAYELTDNGLVISITSENADIVKKIQRRTRSIARMKSWMEKGSTTTSFYDDTDDILSNSDLDLSNLSDNQGGWRRGQGNDGRQTQSPQHGRH